MNGDRLRKRGDTRERTRRELKRLGRRVPGAGLWQAIALIGSVGWPIVLLATGGALLGRYLDLRFASGVQLTLLLLALGTIAGSLIAYRALTKGGAP